MNDTYWRKEIYSLKSQIRTLRVLYLAVIMIFVYSTIRFQILYTDIRSFYQSSVDNYQELMIQTELQNRELEKSQLLLEESLQILESLNLELQ